MIKEKAYDIFKYLCNIYNIDIEQMVKDNPTPRGGTLGVIHCQYRLFNIYKSYIEQEYDLMYIKAVNEIKTLVKNNSELKDITIDNMQELINIYQQCILYIKDFDDWYSEDRKVFREYIFSNPLLKDTDKTDDNFQKVTKLMVDECKSTITTKKLIHTYVYKQGDAYLEPTKNYEYVISDTLVISDDIDILFSGIKTYDDDLLHYQILTKIEEIIDYTYFIIAISYKDTILIGTDFIHFDNPRTKSSRRNPSRTRESWWDDVYLPYGIIDDIIKWRKENKELVFAYKGTNEVYVKQLSEYLPYINKICLWILCDCITGYITTNEQQQIYTLGAITNEQKLLGDGKIVVEQDELEKHFSSINYEECKRYQNQLLYNGEKQNNTSLVHVSTDIITKLDSYDKNWLVTKEGFDKMTIWSLKEQQRIEKQEILNIAYKNNYDNDKIAIRVALRKNLEWIYEIALSGDNVMFYDLEYKPVPRFGYAGVNIPICCMSGKQCAYNIWGHDIRIHPDSESNKPYWGSDYYCTDCEEFKARGQKGIYMRIEHWSQLCMLLNCKREELPKSYQNYTSHRFIPYYGNQILNNTNPEFLIQDPLSKIVPNGIVIYISLCGYCFKKLTKEYKQYDESIIVYSSKYNCTVVINDYKKWNEDNSHLNKQIQLYI